MKVILVAIWRVWFYVAIAIAIILILPFILITAQRGERYPVFFKWSRVWSRIVLFLSGFWIKAEWKERPKKNEVYIICPNHTSMIDIMVTLALFPNCFMFIGKKELAKLPLFGYFYKKTNILVDRASFRSRQDAFDRGAEKLEEGIGLCIFPEGGVPKPEVTLARFKSGAFRLAAKYKLPIIPVSYPDNKRHLPYDYKSGSPGRLRAIIHPFILPNGDGSEEVNRLSQLCHKQILSGLEK